MAWSLGLLSVGPRIAYDDERLTAVTGWKMRMLTLGLTLCRVTVDPEQRVVIVERRRLWLFKRRRRIKFGWIAAVTYGYSDQSFGGGLSMAHDSFDIFSVGLRLHDDEEFRLFAFFGDGTFTNNSIWPDWMYASRYRHDFTGTQEQESRVFAEVLSRMIDVKMLPSRH
jgi:hypothetical protein